MAKHLKSFKVTIRGSKWAFRVYSPEQYLIVEKEEETSNSAAFTSRENNFVAFSTECLDRVTVRHELVHVFVCAFHTYSADLTGLQVEEVFAEFLSTHAEEYIKVGNKVWRTLNAWKKSYAKKQNAKAAK